MKDDNKDVWNNYNENNGNKTSVGHGGRSLIGITSQIKELEAAISDADFKDIFKIEEIQEIQDAFSKATGVASIITEPDGTPITKPSNFCRLCKDIIRKTSKGLQNCMHSDSQLGNYNPEGPLIRRCLSGGLREGGASISIGNRHVANWLVGQVRFAEQDEQKMREYARLIEADEDEFLTALSEVNVMSSEQFEQVCRALFLITNQISDIAYHNIQSNFFVNELTHTEKLLDFSEKQYRRLFNELICGFALHEIICDDKGKPIDYRFLEINPAFEKLTGLKGENVVGKTAREVLPGIETHWIENFGNVALTGEPIYVENYSIVLGKYYEVSAFSPEKNKFATIFFDITDRKRAEEERNKLEGQIQHAQKLESLGVLAGGIAHDFNNILVSILGNADLALMEMSALSPARDTVGEIKKAALRASELTNQMLAYSGKGQFVIESINMNELIEEMKHMLDISISKKAILKYNFADNLPTVEADASQIRQIVMNLITNASDAIGEKSGIITISTSLLEAEPDYLADIQIDNELQKGYYVAIEVSDTGCGMDKETREKLFDPFYTTKFTGRGLGLSATLGIVRGHKGAIKIYSEVDKGTTFKVLLPCSNKPKVHDRKKLDGRLEMYQGTGTILVVDDEESVRSVVKRMFERFGFTVMTAADGREGVDVFREHAGTIDLVLLDMTMPHLNGEEAFRELRKIQKDVTVVLASGFNEQDATSRFTGKGLSGFIQKPFQLDNLMQKITDVMLKASDQED